MVIDYIMGLRHAGNLVKMVFKNKYKFMEMNTKIKIGQEHCLLKETQKQSKENSD